MPAWDPNERKTHKNVVTAVLCQEKWQREQKSDFNLLLFFVLFGGSACSVCLGISCELLV